MKILLILVAAAAVTFLWGRYRQARSRRIARRALAQRDEWARRDRYKVRVMRKGGICEEYDLRELAAQRRSRATDERTGPVPYPEPGTPEHERILALEQRFCAPPDPKVAARQNRDPSALARILIERILRQPIYSQPGCNLFMIEEDRPKLQAYFQTKATRVVTGIANEQAWFAGHRYLVIVMETVGSYDYEHLPETRPVCLWPADTEDEARATAQAEVRRVLELHGDAGKWIPGSVSEEACPEADGHEDEPRVIARYSARIQATKARLQSNRKDGIDGKDIHAFVIGPFAGDILTEELLVFLQDKLPTVPLTTYLEWVGQAVLERKPHPNETYKAHESFLDYP